MVNGVVYVGSDSNGSVYALNASTGAKLWSYQYRSRSAFLARSGEWGGLCRQYYGSNLYALNASTGAQLWSYKPEAVLSSPAVVNGVVYVGGG